MIAAPAAIAALYSRGEGPGQAVEVSMLAGAFSLQTGGIMRHEQMSSIFQAGPADPLGPVPCYRLFEAADGLYLFIACGNATFFNKFALALDRPDLVADPRFEGAPWGIPKEHWQTLKDILEPIIRTRPRDDSLRPNADSDDLAPHRDRSPALRSARPPFRRPRSRFLQLYRRLVRPDDSPADGRLHPPN